MRTITRGAAVAVLCAPLLLSACTIGDVGQQDATTAAAETTETTEAATATSAVSDVSEAPEDPDQPNAEPVETDPDAPGARGLAVGDCVADMGQLDGTGEIDVVDCAEPHAGEVYAQADIAGKTLFPGADPLGQEAGEICGGDAFTGYVGLGYDVSSLDVVTMMPSKESWAQDDRTVTCVVTDPNLGQIEGTLAQSWR
ncbi:septum formation family protein [Corynebacterium kalidii]|jgi:hypothetical protein